MKKTVYFNNFCDAFEDYGRKENFSYDGLRKLFDFFEDFEESIGEEIELDVIAICCDFTEYATMQEFRDNYGEQYQTIEDVENSTTVIVVSEYTNDNGDDDFSFIVQDF